MFDDDEEFSHAHKLLLNLVNGQIKATVPTSDVVDPATSEVPIKKAALVIGGGVSGIETALELAEQGHQVVLVEKQASIGGIMAQLDKTYPTMDCSI